MGVRVMASLAPAAPSLRRAALPLAILALSMTAAFTALGSFATVQEGAKAELALTDSHLALVQGWSAALPLFLLSVPIGVLVDRLNRVRILTALSLCWTAGT